MLFLTAATLIVWLLSFWAVAGFLRGRGFLCKLKRLFLAAGLASLGVLLSLLLVVLQAFQTFSGESLIARVTTRRLTPEEFELVYTPMSAAGAGTAKTVHLRGDQWAISGGIVKWHPWLTALGLPSRHKPTWLSGQFSSLERQRARPPTVEPIEFAADRLWQAFYWADPYVPFVEAVYGSSAYVFVEPGSVHEVYVTSSGYLIKRLRRVDAHGPPSSRGGF